MLENLILSISLDSAGQRVFANVQLLKIVTVSKSRMFILNCMRTLLNHLKHFLNGFYP